MDKIYLVDALNILHRSYFAIKGLSNEKGEPTGALYGFINSLNKIVKDFNPTHLVIIFDGPDNKQHRQKLYEQYKAHRPSMPDDLYAQLVLAKQFCKIAGYPTLCIPGWEADDVIGSITTWAEKQGDASYILSSDKDLCQLVSDKTFMININKENLLVDREVVHELHGVYPEQIADLLGLMGDSSDNIPGVPSIGPKSASSLLEKFGSLDNLLSNIEMLDGKKRELFEKHKQDALVSRELATIVRAIDFELSKEQMRFAVQASEQLIDFYKSMRFNKFLEGLSDKKEDKKPQQVQQSYTLVDDEQQIEDLITELLTKKLLVFDTETTSINPMQSRIVGISFSYQPGIAHYIPLNGRTPKERALELLRPLFEESTVAFCGHNIKFDLHALANEQIFVKNVAFDTMLASYMLTPQEPRHGLDALCMQHFSKEKIPITNLILKGKQERSMLDVPLPDICEYCCEDADYTFRLYALFEPKLKEAPELYKLFKEVEIPLIRQLMRMERSGIFVDRSYLHNLSEHLVEKLTQLESEIELLAGKKINLNSPKQVGELLFTTLKIPSPTKNLSTSAEVLEQLDHPCAQKILNYRLLEKLRSTYVDSLPEQIDENTGKIHCTFMQTVAATGRLSCQNPNLQNIPIRSEEGRKIRAAFKPESEHSCFVAADYSQIELRLLAHMSEDPYLIEAFTNGEDVHKATAALIFDLPKEEVTDEMRQNAKAVNFGIIYGQQAFGLSKGQKISFQEADAFIKKYFERLKKVKEHLEKSVAIAKEKGYSETLTGRRRPIPDIKSSNPFLRKAAERLAVNSPLQGTNADLIKMAMLSIQKRLDRELPDASMLLQIHDELLFELPKNAQKLEKLKEILTEEMSEKIEKLLKMRVPLLIDIKVGKNWGEC